MKYDDIYHSYYVNNRGREVYNTYGVIVPKGDYARLFKEGEQISYDQVQIKY